jgi:hypothetical protein
MTGLFTLLQYPKKFVCARNIKRMSSHTRSTTQSRSLMKS